MNKRRRGRHRPPPPSGGLRSGWVSRGRISTSTIRITGPHGTPLKRGGGDCGPGKGGQLQRQTPHPPQGLPLCGRGSPLSRCWSQGTGRRRGTRDPLEGRAVYRQVLVYKDAFPLGGEEKNHPQHIPCTQIQWRKSWPERWTRVPRRNGTRGQTCKDRSRTCSETGPGMSLPARRAL